MPTSATVHRQRDKTLAILLDVCDDIIDAYAYLSIIYTGIWIDEYVDDTKRTMIMKRAIELQRM